MASLALLAAVLGTASPAPPAPEPPARALEKERYDAVTHPGGLPADLRAGWAAALGQKELFVAAPGEPFESTDLVRPGRPRVRFIVAAVGPAYAVVHFEAGGIAHFYRATIFARRPDGPAQVVWDGFADRRYEGFEALRSAIRGGSLWKKGRPRRTPAV
ncbi:MAG TPA: hypothetical protein VFM29_05340 [Vicinamibacteria bacterium]|nr:hypothetical protein [Vicinamibacteria bacterium]